MSPARSASAHYGTVAIAIHWLTAVLIAALIVLGLISTNLDAASGVRPLLLAVHAVLGVSVLVVTIGRMLWWWFADRRPAPVAGVPGWQQVVAQWVHRLLYVAILALAASGIALMIASGAVQVLFNGEGSVPDFWDFAPRAPHRILAFSLMGLMLFHIGAAIYHQAVMRDRLMDRMLPK